MTFKKFSINFNNQNSQKGVSVYLALIITAVLLAIIFGMNTILTGQIKSVRDIGYSVVAYYAAETGIEAALFDQTCDETCSDDVTLDLGGGKTASYHIEGMLPDGSTCEGDNYCIQSVGSFGEIRRAIQVSR